MVDFINEVEDELRKDQYNVLLRKWGPLIAAICVAIVAAAGLYEYMSTSKDRAARNASISYVAATDLADAGEAEKAISQLKQIAEKAGPGYSGMALTRAAGLELENGNTAQAATLMDAAAGKFDKTLHQQLAQYKAALILADQGRHDDVIQRIEPLTESGAPFAYLARELRGYTHLAMDNITAARSDFLYLSSSPGAPQGVAQRASQMLMLTPSLSQRATAPADMTETPEIEAPDPVLPEDAPEEDTE